MNVRLYCLVSANNANAESKLSYYQVKGKVSLFAIVRFMLFLFLYDHMNKETFLYFLLSYTLISSWLLISVNFTIQFSTGTLFCFGNIMKVMKMESSKRS